MSQMSMSVSHGKVGDPRHNLIDDYRTQLDNVVPERTHLNVVLVDDDLRLVYDDLFGEALRDYNAKKISSGHPERQIDDYLEHIQKSKQEHPLYEMVVQVGNVDTNPAADEACRVMSEEVYRDWLVEFERRMKNLRVVEAVYHVDEATPHLHVKYVPFSTGNKRGLEVKNSLSGALKEMGYADTRDVNWDYMKMLEEVARNHGIERLEMGCQGVKRLDVREYKSAVRNGEYRFNNDPALIAAMLEQQQTIAEQEKVIEGFETALRAVADSRVTEYRSVKAQAARALQNGSERMSWLAQQYERINEIVDFVRSRVQQFILNPVPQRLRGLLSRDTVSAFECEPQIDDYLDGERVREATLRAQRALAQAQGRQGSRVDSYQRDKGMVDRRRDKEVRRVQSRGLRSR